MKQQGRLGDTAFCGADAHGCPACPHPVQGPAISGSPDVQINALPALREGDRGIHAACCGPNQWEAVGGAAHVLINNRRAYRNTDPSKHCGGDGKLIIGSPDVFVGDKGGVADPAKQYDQAFILVYEDDGEPVKDRRYRLTDAQGQCIEGRTDEHGRTHIVFGQGPDPLSLEILQQDPW